MSEIHSTPSRWTRQLRSLWLAMAASAALVAAAPLVFHFACGFPLFSFRSWVTAGALTFGLAVPAFWACFSRQSEFTGRMAAIAISIIVIVSAFVAWRFH